MIWKDKNGVTQNSKYVVTVSNWHFNRDTLKELIAPTCKLEHVMVTLKLSSSVFESNSSPSAAAAGGATDDGADLAEKDDGSSSSGRAVTSHQGDVFHFDKNGCIIPYAAFVSLIENSKFDHYLQRVKNRFNYREPNLQCEEISAPPNTEGEEEEEEEEEDRRKKRKMLYSKRKRPVFEYADLQPEILVSSAPGDLGSDNIGEEPEVMEDAPGLITKGKKRGNQKK
jgi:hypothetical protein